jgi:hypothetical protein
MCTPALVQPAVGDHMPSVAMVDCGLVVQCRP